MVIGYFGTALRQTQDMLFRCVRGLRYRVLPLTRFYPPLARPDSAVRAHCWYYTKPASMFNKNLTKMIKKICHEFY